jgi:hypothetical protein
MSIMKTSRHELASWANSDVVATRASLLLAIGHERTAIEFGEGQQAVIDLPLSNQS